MLREVEYIWNDKKNLNVACAREDLSVITCQGLHSKQHKSGHLIQCLTRKH